MSGEFPIDLQSTDGGVLLPVKAQAGARQNRIRGARAGSLRVAVTQVAEKGRANKAIVALLAKQLRLPKSQIQLVSGNTSSEKKFLITGVRREDIAQRLFELLREAD